MNRSRLGCARGLFAAAIMLANVVVGSPPAAVAKKGFGTSPSVKPKPSGRAEFTYTADVIHPDQTSERQAPVSVATIRIPVGENVNLAEISVDLELEPAILSTRKGDLATPAALVRYDEAEVRLVSPGGEVFDVSEALHYRLANGDGPSPYPVSAIAGAGWARATVEKQPLVSIVAPKRDPFGLPMFDGEGRLETEAVGCSGPWGWGTKADRSWGSSCYGQKTLFKSTLAPKTTFSARRIQRALDQVRGRASWGTWLIVVTDTQPLFHDMLPGLSRYDPTTLELLSVADVPRFRIRKATMRTQGAREKVGGERVVTRHFVNETNLHGDPVDALRGASQLVASGVRFGEATVFLQLKSVRGSKTSLRAVLIDPRGRRLRLGKRLKARGEYHQIEIGSAGLKHPFHNDPVDGVWQLRLENRQGKDVTHKYNIAWGLAVKGVSTDVVAIERLAKPENVSDGSAREFRFHLSAPGKQVRDLEVVVDSTNHLAFRNGLRVFAPDGTLVARTCASYEQPFADRCLRTDQRGRTLRIPIGQPRSMDGVWRVRWQPERAPAAALSEQSGGSRELSGDCPENARLFGERGPAALAGDRLNAASLHLVGMRLGLSETRLTPDLFGHRVLDEAAGRGQGGFVVHRASGSTLYPMHRSAFEREFWRAYDDGHAASSSFLAGGDPQLDSVIRSFEDAASRDSLRAHIALRAGISAAWASQGTLPALSRRVAGIAAQSRSLDEILRLDEPARRIQIHDKRSFAMDDTRTAPQQINDGNDGLAADLFVELATSVAGPLVEGFLIGTFADWDEMPWEFAKAGSGIGPLMVVLDHGLEAAGIDTEKKPPQRYCDVEVGNACTAFTPEASPEGEDGGTDSGETGDDGGGSGGREGGDSGGGNTGGSGDDDGGGLLHFCDPSVGICQVDCAPEQDTCGEGNLSISPFGQALIDAMVEGSQRTDTLTLSWGSLAPYVQCAPHQSCGGAWGPATEALLASVTLDDRIAPYIDCGPESSGVCKGVRAPAAMCRDWGSGFVDPLPGF